MPGYAICLLNETINKFYGKSTEKQYINKNTIFMCASLSKTVMVYFVLKLVIENKLNLDSNITEYLQNTELHKDLIKDKRCNNITVRMLLTHTSGLPNNKGCKLLFNPGKKYSYSGTGFFILQQIIEKIYGKNLESIFKTLKLENSSFIYRKKFDENMSYPYDENNLPYKKEAHIKYKEPHGAFSLYTTLEDYYKFIQILSKNKEIVKLMLQKQKKLSEDIYIGLGVFLYRNYIWQYGDEYFIKNFLYINLTTKKGFIYFSNTIYGWYVISNLLNKNIIKYLQSNEYSKNNITFK